MAQALLDFTLLTCRRATPAPGRPVTSAHHMTLRKRARPSPGWGATTTIDGFAFLVTTPLYALGCWAHTAGHTLVFFGLMGVASLVAWRSYRQHNQRHTDRRA